MIKISLTIKQLIKSGIHIGHQKNRWNTKMSSYIIGKINNINIINIEYTIIILRIITNLIKETVSNKGKLLIILNKIKYIKNIINKIYNKHIKYNTNNKIINGYLTNNKYINNHKYIPDIIIFFNINKNIETIKEANKLKIPIIALIDTNNNPINITYPIPGNNDSIQSIQLITNIINNAVLLGITNNNIFFKYKYDIYKYINNI
jgi:small subunit ribosomal protein S2